MTHVPLHPRASRRLSRRLTSVLALALTVALISAGVAVADDLQADGDGLVPVGNNPTVTIGDVCQNDQVSGTVLLAIRRTGAGQVYANNAAITVSAGTPSGAATVTHSFSDNSIGLPGNWGGVSNNTVSGDTATSTVTVTAGASTGAKSASIVYSASGDRNTTPVTTLTRTATVTVNWNVVVCADTTPPVLSGVPSNMTVEGNTTGGANVSWAAPTATDVVDPSPVVSCSPSSGSFFALGGPHAVSCSATDASGNSASAGFQVTVVDTTAPSLSVPSNMTVEGNTTGGANVSWTAPTATDIVDPSPVVGCSPSSGSFFALGGPHAVSCSATDASGNSASAGFQVTVRDTVAPTLSGMPGNISAVATGGGQAVVSWTNPTATDVVDPAPSVSCSPASGSSFPVGTTPVTCTATDASGNVRSASFQVSVVYSWSGFLRPVDNLPTVNRVKAGSAVPVKFSLSGNQGLNIFMAGSPTSQAVSCNNSAPVDPVEETVTAGSSSLSYDPTNDQYNYVWKTDKGWANQCRQLTLRLADGSTQTAVFHFTR